jgi:hypothetical protein
MHGFAMTHAGSHKRLFEQACRSGLPKNQHHSRLKQLPVSMPMWLWWIFGRPDRTKAAQLCCRSSSIRPTLNSHERLASLLQERIDDLEIRCGFVPRYILGNSQLNLEAAARKNWFCVRLSSAAKKELAQSRKACANAVHLVLLGFCSILVRVLCEDSKTIASALSRQWLREQIVL